MFCANCGKELSDGSEFCSNCGASQTGKKLEKVVSKEQDTEMLLTVKPKFTLYNILPGLIALLFCVIFMAIPMLMAEEATEIVLPIILVIIAIFVVFIAISALITKKQYKCFTYNFYKTKVIYRDSFLNISEKEVKYKYIREASMTQGLIQRAFKLGNIILYTNAESGFLNGIRIMNVENPKEVYSKIKEIIGE